MRCNLLLHSSTAAARLDSAVRDFFTRSASSSGRLGIVRDRPQHPAGDAGTLGARRYGSLDVRLTAAEPGRSLKLAVTPVSALRVMTQVDVPVQAPDHPANAEPGFGEA